MEYKALIRKNLSKEEFIKICNNSASILEALQSTNLNRCTFTKYAKELKCFNPKQGNRNGVRKKGPQKFKVDDWNNNLMINVSRASIKKWIFNLNLFPKKCNKCGLDKWNGQDISLELNHINGSGHENIRTNLELLCPNCHAQTPTYRSKNLILKYGKK